MPSNINYRPVVVFAPNVLAGAEKVVITGIHALFDLGLDPHLIVIQETRSPKLARDFIQQISPQIKISIVESQSALDLKLVSQIWNCLKKEDKKYILHTHGFKALVACKLIRHSVKHIHTHHGNTSHTFKVKVYEWLADLAMKRCDHVIAVSNEMKELLLKNLAPYKKISVVTNMLSFKNAADIRKTRASHTHNESDKIKLIFIGRLSTEKGLVPLLNNLAALSSSKEFHLTVLGDGPEMETAKSIVQSKNLADQVSFHGFVPNPSDYLKKADILVLPSFTEGLPMTLIESLASGVPVIGNDVGAIKSLLINGQNGILTKNNDFAEWEKAFSTASQNIAQWQAFTLAHAPELEENYSAKKWAIKTREIFEKIIL